MPKHGTSKYLGRRVGKLTVVDTAYEKCQRQGKRGKRPTVSSFLICRCDCGRSVKAPMRSFVEGARTSCEWCDLMGQAGDAAAAAFRESGRRIEARERAALSRVRPYRRPADPDLYYQRDRWMQ